MSNLYTAADLAALKNIADRNADGTGNNINDPDWGSTNTTFRRVTENSYKDGVSEVATAPDEIPTVKDVSDAIFDLQPDEQNDPHKANHNENLVFFGQLLVHELVSSAPGGPPLPDPTFPFGVRNGFVIEDGVAQQINTKTSFLDLSMVYGPSDVIADQLKDGARLILGPDGLLPTLTEIPGATADLAGPFFTGDQRANQTPQLLSQQTIWARNHNWHVDQLEAKYGGYWSDDEIFNAARALNEAEWQNVVYNEYLTTLFGDKALSKYTGYKAYVDPSIINEFTAVASRFGHDQSSNEHVGLDENGANVFTRTLGEAFGEGFGGAANTSDILDQWIRGQLSQSSQETDGKVVDGNRELLFGFPLDLAAVDVGRGRDHGVSDYNLLRQGLGLSTYSSFEQFAYANRVSADDLAALKTLYGDDIGKMDALVGAMLEKDAKGSTLGETITKLHVMQFEALRDGDKFYYENRFKGNAELIKEIKETSLADIVARTTGIEHVYHDAFAAHDRIGGDDYANTLSGTKRGDLLIGFGGNDALFGKNGDDDVYGGNGNDRLYGWHGIDRLYGDAGDDRLYGEEGKDHLHGGAGNDTMWGGAANDVFHFAAYSGYDTIKDFKIGKDKVDLSDVVGFYDLADVKAAMYQVGKATHLDLGDYDVLVLENTKVGQFKSASFDYSDDYLIV